MSDTPKVPPGYKAVPYDKYKSASQCLACAGDRDAHACVNFACSKNGNHHILVKLDLRHFVTEATK